MERLPPSHGQCGGCRRRFSDDLYRSREEGEGFALRDSIAGWLHEVACRLAAKAKSAGIRRHVKESQVAAQALIEPLSERTVREAQTLLHEELKRLPESFRAPLVLCYLESTTQEEAARQLGWSYRTLKRRLERGRALLELRLTRRGLTLSAALSTGLLALLSAREFDSIYSPGRRIRCGRKAPVAISASVAALVQGALRAMLPVKIMALAAVMVLTGLVATGLIATGSWSDQGDEPGQAAIKAAVRQPIAGKAVKEKVDKPTVDRYGDPLPAGAVARLGTARFRHAWRLDTSADFSGWATSCRRGQ